MTIPSNVTTELTNLQSQLKAAEPLSGATAPTIVALQLNSKQLVNDINTALINAEGNNTTNMSGSIAFAQNPTAGSTIVLGGQPIVAGASWNSSSTQITLGYIAPSWLQIGMQVYDNTISKIIGVVQGVSGTTLTLARPAAFSSQGSTDLLSIQSVVTFVSASPLNNQVVIGSTLANTLLALILFLGSPGGDINISSCSYSIGSASNTLQIVFNASSPIPPSGFAVATNVTGATAVSSKLVANDLDDWSAPTDPLLIVNGFLGIVENATDQNTLCNMAGYVGRANINLDQLV